MKKRHKLIATAIILALPTLTLMKSASAHPPGACMDHGGFPAILESCLACPSPLAWARCSGCWSHWT